MSNINVIYASDDRYAPVLSVSIRSLLYASKNTENIRIYIIDDGISEKNKRVLENIVRSFESTVVFCRKYDFSKFEDINFTTDRGSITQYARLFISSLLPREEKSVLYLDCDTLILHDIQELYDTDFSENIAAGVGDAFSRYHWKVLGLGKDDVYINSGVILINLEKWRSYSIEDKFKKEIAKKRGKFLQGDQGLISSVLNGRIYRLPVKYNVVSYLYDFKFDEMKYYRKPYNYYTEDEVKKAVKNPTIVHFTSSFASMRPWQRKDCEHPYADYWRECYCKNGYEIEDSPYKASIRVYSVLSHKLVLFILGLVHAYLKPYVWELQYKILERRKN